MTYLLLWITFGAGLTIGWMIRDKGADALVEDEPQDQPSMLRDKATGSMGHIVRQFHAPEGTTMVVFFPAAEEPIGKINITPEDSGTTTIEDL